MKMRKVYLKYFLGITLAVVITGNVKAQVIGGIELDGKQSGTVSTSVPFLLITPDSRAGAMGDVGVSTAADANAMHHNAAKLAFAPSRSAVGLSYVPWLRALGINNINLAYLSGYYRFDDRQTIGASFRYFSFGEILFTDERGNLLPVYNPGEFAIDASYIRKLSDDFSMAMAARYIHSDLGSGVYNGNEMSAGNAFAADVSVFYNKNVQLFNTTTNVAWGVNINNIGTKMQYGNNKSFLPTCLKLGGTADFQLGEKNSLAWTLELNKLLVSGDATSSVPGSIFGSFSDRQMAFGTGAEYWFANTLAFRSGFYSDNASGSNRQYFTAGAGLKYSAVAFDLSYLIPSKANNPMEKTIRFSLLINFGNGKKESTTIVEAVKEQKKND